MNQIAKNILSRVETWPEEDQQELLEMVRAIEARRSGVLLSEDEQTAIEAARRSDIVSDEKVQAFWKRFGVA